MDEEDMREAEEAQTLSTTNDFAGFGTMSDPSQRRTLMDIFRPTGESVGVKLLKRMGWKEGQGIGPHIKREADLGEGQVAKGKTHSFAPTDVPLVTFPVKTDLKGLGHGDSADSIANKFGFSQTGSKQRSVVHVVDDSEDDDDAMFSPSLIRKSGAPKPRKGGFGVGVLNDTGSDDDDPYAMGPKMSYNKTIGGDKPSKKKSASKKSTANPALHKKPILLSQKLNGLGGTLRKCHDGTLPMDGFELGDEVNAMATLSLDSEKYKPPSVPPGWTSSLTPAKVTTGTADYKSTSDVAKASQHTSKSRASALGEAALPGKSVFDYLSASARDRLAAASGNSDLPPGLGEVPDGYTPKASAQESLQDLIPKLDQEVALLALKRSTERGEGWMPYAEDLDKRERYKTFLEIRAGLRPTEQGDEIPPRASGVSQEDWLQELQEFARAAEVFKPVSGLMASRFTSAKSGMPGSTADADASTSDLLSYKRQKPEDPQEAAAKMGMFGHMTRSTTNFFPTRLLCKRFGVAMPDIGARTEPDAMGAGAGMSAAYSAQEPSVVPEHPRESQKDANQAGSVTETADSSQLPVTQKVGNETIDPDRNEALEGSRPGMDLFKAVFGDDDSDDGDD
jgi:G patch domain-containing protein 1